MRARIAGQYPTDRTWDLKHVRGGLVDLDFIAQYLQLRHAAAHPEILSTNTADALARMAAAGVLEQAAADALIAADRLWRRLQGLLRLTVGEGLDEAAIPEGLRRSLAEAGDAADFVDLKDRMTSAAAQVRAQFDRLIETPAQRAAAEGDPAQGTRES